MHGRRGVVDRANDRKLVGVAGDLGKDFADLHARGVRRNGLERPAHFRRSVRLGIEGVDLARSADQEKHDAIRVGVFGGGGRAALFLGASEVTGQRQTQRRQRSGVQEITSCITVAKPHAARRVETKHRVVSRRQAETKAGGLTMNHYHEFSSHTKGGNKKEAGEPGVFISPWHAGTDYRDAIIATDISLSSFSASPGRAAARCN